MKKLSVLVLAALFLLSTLFAVFCGTSAQAADNDVYKTVTYRQLFSLMTGFGYTVNMRSSDADVDDVEPYSDDDFIWWIIGGPRKPRIDIGDSGRRVEFYVYYTSDNPDLLDRTNAWNRDHFYGRAHVDGDGDPVLELELDTTGGVTEARIHDFFKTCVMSFESWKRDVVD